MLLQKNKLSHEDPIHHPLPNPISRLPYCLTCRDKEWITPSGTWLHPSILASQWCWQKREAHWISSSEKRERETERLVKDHFPPVTWLPLIGKTVLMYILQASKTWMLALGKHTHVQTKFLPLPWFPSMQHTLILVGVSSLQPKEQSSGAYILMTDSLSLLCVHAALSHCHSQRLMGRLTLGWPKYLEGKWWPGCLPKNFTQLGQPPPPLGFLSLTGTDKGSERTSM